MSEREAFDAEHADRTAGDSSHDARPQSEPVVLAPVPTTLVALQRSAGNRAVNRWLAESFRGEGPDRNPIDGGGSEGEGGEAAQEEVEEQETAEAPGELQRMSAAAEAPRRMVVSATFVGDTVTHEMRYGELTVPSDRAKLEVKPTGTPTYDGSAASSSCLPVAPVPADIDWDVVDKGKTWGVKVTKFTTRGAIEVNPTPNLPTTMTTPNTANPVDGGNINDTAGNNNWKFAIKEMKEYNKVNGGRSNHWHSTAASDAHEYAHWNIDWIKDVLGKVWPKANRDIDAMTIPKKDAADEAAARVLLQPKVDARIATAKTKIVSDWNAVPDDPGLAGANGYKAGQRVLDGLITSVNAYAKSKKWT